MSSPDPDKVLELLAGAGGLPRRAAAPPAAHCHLSGSRLCELAASGGGHLTEAERADWSRVLECSDCFNRLAGWRRLVLNPESGQLAPAVPFERVWEAVQGEACRVVLEWVGASLVVHAAAAHATLRRRPAFRSRGAGLNSAHDVWECRMQFGTYTVTLSFEGRPGRPQSWQLRGVLDPAELVVVKLFSEGKCLDEKELDSVGQVLFSGLGPEAYALEFSKPDHLPIATIHLTSRISS